MFKKISLGIYTKSRLDKLDEKYNRNLKFCLAFYIMKVALVTSPVI